MTASNRTCYPRPDFQRSKLNWTILNGTWDFLFDDADVGEDQGWQKGLPAHGVTGSNSLSQIKVPYVFQSKASGLNNRGVHEVVWYARNLQDIRTDAEKRLGYRHILRFGAVDYHAKVWVNGQFVGEHRGGHVPFEFDITNVLDTQPLDHRVVVRVYDSAYDLMQPRGKQYWKPEPESIFYTPSSGIWQSVWLESVPKIRIADSSHGTILRSNDIRDGMIDCRIAIIGRPTRRVCSVQIEATFAGTAVSQSGLMPLPEDEDFVRFDHSVRLSEVQLFHLPRDIRQQAPLGDRNCWHAGVALWSPEYPQLYDLTIRLFDSSGIMIDEVKTSTGIRSIGWNNGDGIFRLNERPYFQALLLDQGYWPDSLMTAPTNDGFKQDIELSKEMGFNGSRKHQKAEDPLFLYWADRLGFLVWGEMASCYRFSIDQCDRFDQEWMEMVKRDVNHPCIVAWTPVNESWGYPDLANSTRQRDHIRSLYYMTKTLDPTRPVNDNCGWEHVVTDLSTFHDYADADGMAERCASVQSIVKKGKPMFLESIRGPAVTFDEGSKHRDGALIICTELGGVNIAASDDPERRSNWGYTTAADSQDLIKRIEGILMATIVGGHVCGIVWTQL